MLKSAKLRNSNHCKPRENPCLKMGVLVVLVVVASLSTGCASLGKKLKAFLGGKPAPDVAESSELAISTPRFSETDNLRYSTDRKYRRMTKDRFEEEAEVAASQGSLWIMEGQGAYLFAQNRTRLVGDLLSVQIRGAPQTQLQTKTRVIAKLLEKLERPEGMIAPPVARAPAAVAPVPALAPGAQAANAPPGPAGAAPAPVAAAAPPPLARGEVPFSVDRVPTRIVEVMKDGSYRVKGSQEFMIGKREYRVIVTGIVRPEDFNEDGIEAEKVLDSQFDIVSNKRGATL